MLPLTPMTYKLWWLLALGPLVFLICIVAASVFWNVRGAAPADIAPHVVALMPHILLVVLGSMALGLTGFSAQVASAWTMPQAGQAIADIALGVVVGGALAWAYFVWLAPALAMLQRSLGDYVPPDSILPALSDSAIVFFIANVLLAPWVEETLYRGVALPMLSPQLGHWGAVLVGCLCFGLLHWPGGIWYVVLTGVVGGGVFTGLYYTRGGILAPYAAHVVLNGIEFWVAWRLARSV